jgi:hypothetical protein
MAFVTIVANDIVAAVDVIVAIVYVAVDTKGRRP